jgi:hypothetical protein
MGWRGAYNCVKDGINFLKGIGLCPLAHLAKDMLGNAKSKKMSSWLYLSALGHHDENQSRDRDF